MERLDPSITVVNVALPGQDDNWPPPEHSSIPEFSQDVLRLADSIGIERFIVGGHSLGGMISVDMLRFGPDRIAGAIAIEGWTHYTVSQNAFNKNVADTQSPEQKAFLAQVRRNLQDRWDPLLRERYTSQWRKWNGWEILAASDIPVLEIWGDRGNPRPNLETMQIPDKPNIEIAWIENCSHSLHVEAPELLAELINKFIHRVMRS
jgi:pimeloyl-ACP methyl ester carboxylesterase